MTPTADTSETTERNGAVCNCGATTFTFTREGKKRCAKGHVLVGNDDAAITGEHGADFRREHQAEIDAMADQFARDAGYPSLAAAPLGFQIASIALSRTAKIGDLAYWKMLEAGGPLSESGKPRRAYSIWADTNRDLARDLKGAMSEVVAARPPGAHSSSNPYFEEFQDKSAQELFDIAVRLAEELSALIDGHSRIETTLSVPVLPTRLPRPNSDPAFSRASQQPSTITQNSPSNSGVSSAIPPPRSVTRTSAPSPTLSADSASAPPQSSAAREGAGAGAGAEDGSRPDSPATVYNHLVTERDVRRCMEDTGDLAQYEAGKISRQEAVRMTANWLRHAMEMPR